MKNRLAIIVPYRNRRHHIQHFLPHYRRLLPAAQFMIVEQSENKPFNRAKLLNIGASLAWPDFDYFAMHDVDMLVQGRPDYSYPDCPTLLATNASQFGWQMPFPEYFGGVVLFNKPDFDRCNGYSNEFWGWGGEDNSMYYTVLSKGLEIRQRPHRYLSLAHPRSHPTGYDAEKMEQAKQPRAADDGLNNLTFDIVSERPVTNGRIITVEI